MEYDKNINCYLKSHTHNHNQKEFSIDEYTDISDQRIKQPHYQHNKKSNWYNSKLKNTDPLDNIVEYNICYKLHKK